MGRRFDTMRGLKIFSGRANKPLAERICKFLNLRSGNVDLIDFPDGEIACKFDEDVRGRDVFLIQPTCPPVNKNLMELLIMIDSCRRASAARITAVLPYFGYARQDRKDEGRVPITAKLVANLITRAGADRGHGRRCRQSPRTRQPHHRHRAHRAVSSNPREWQPPEPRPSLSHARFDATFLG